MSFSFGAPSPSAANGNSDAEQKTSSTFSFGTDSSFPATPIKGKTIDPVTPQVDKANTPSEDTQGGDSTQKKNVTFAKENDYCYFKKSSPVVPYTGSSSAADWLVSHAVALGCSCKKLGGFGTRTLSEQDKALFPDDLVKLLHVFQPASKSKSEKPEPSNASSDTQQSPRDAFVGKVCKRLCLEDQEVERLVDRFLQTLPAARVGAQLAETRKREVLENVTDSERRQIVHKALEKVTSLAEINAIDGVTSLVRLDKVLFEKHLRADVEFAAKHSQEICFGVVGDNDTLSQVEARFKAEQSAILQTVLLLVRTAADTQNSLRQNDVWFSFASSFVSQHATTLEEKAIELLQRRGTSRTTNTGTLDTTLLEILFFLPSEDGKSLMLLLDPDQGFFTHTLWVARIMRLMAKDWERREVDEVVKQLNVDMVTCVWAVYAGSQERFHDSYAEAFTAYGSVAKNEVCAFVLDEFLCKAQQAFKLASYLDLEEDCVFFAGLFAAAYKDREDACENFWKSEEHPLRELLNSFEEVPDALYSTCNALIANDSTARSALQYLENKAILLANMVRYLEPRILLQRFDIMEEAKNLARNVTGPGSLRILNFMVQKFPQQVLTAIVNESDNANSSFSVLDTIKKSLESEGDLGDYSLRVVPGLELIAELLAQADCENASRALHFAFVEAGHGTHVVDQTDLTKALQMLGFTFAVDERSFAKVCRNGQVDYPTFCDHLQSESTSFFRVLSLSLESRRIQVERFALQAVKFMGEVFRSHSSWKYSKLTQRFQIGVYATKVLRACVSLPTGSQDLINKAIDILINDASTQNALVLNISLTPRTPAAQQLVYESLGLLVDLMSLDGFARQKMALLCRENLVLHVAECIGFPRSAPGTSCSFPIAKIALRVLERLIIAMQFAKLENPETVPSIVAMLSRAPTLHKDVAEQIKRGDVSVLYWIGTALEFEPGLAALLLREDEVVRNIMDIFEQDRFNFRDDPRLYYAALDILSIMWHMSYWVSKQRVQSLFPNFWHLISRSLFEDISTEESTLDRDLTKRSYQIGIRALTLQIMTIELDTTSPFSDPFGKLLDELMAEQRDMAWLHQYPTVQTSEQAIEDAIASSEAAWVSFDKFKTLANVDNSLESIRKRSPLHQQYRQKRKSTDTAPGDSHRHSSASVNERLNRRICKYGDSYVHRSDLIVRVFSFCPALVEKVRHLGCAVSLTDAQLGLLTAWKTYMETRCLLDDTSGLVEEDGSGLPPPVRKGRALSTSTSKHAGDMTSYTLVVELTKRLQGLDTRSLLDPINQTYLQAIAEMFASMLHFKVFVKVDRDAHPGLLNLRHGATTGDQMFQKRPVSLRGEGLIFSRDDPERPGVMELIERVSHCAHVILKDVQLKREVIGDILPNLLTGLLILLQVAGEKVTNGQDNAKEQDSLLKSINKKRGALVGLVAKALHRVNSDQVYDICVPILYLLFVQIGPGHHDVFSSSEVCEVLDLLHQKQKSESDKLARMYTDQRDLCTWLVQHGLSDLRVKVLGAGATTMQLPADSGTTRDDTGAKEGDLGAELVDDATRLRELSRRLGYDTENVSSRNKSNRNYRDTVSKSYVGTEDGLTEISVVHLLFDHGVTSVDTLHTLDQQAMLNMGIYKPSDRRRLLNIIQQDQEHTRNHAGIGNAHIQMITSGKEQTAAPGGVAVGGQPSKRQRRYFSRRAGLERQEELRVGLRRLHTTIRAITSSARVECKATVTHLATQGLIQTLARDPLLGVVAGNNHFPMGLDNSDNSTIAFRGYTAQDERDPAHILWCRSLELVASLVRSMDNHYVDQALEFVSAHKGAIMSSLTSFNEDSSVLTLASLEEVLAILGLLRELANHSQRWRLHKEIYGPILSAAWCVLHVLVVGTESRERGSFLEEFVRTFTTSTKVVPKLCINTRAVTVAEKAMDRIPVAEARHRKSSLTTPRSTELYRVSSTLTETSQSEDALHPSIDNFHRARSFSSMSGVAVYGSQLADGDISLLHVEIEYHICQILQELVSLLRNRQLVKLPWQLQIDEQTCQKLPTKYWGVASIPFPLTEALPGLPTSETLLALLGYGIKRMRLFKDCAGPQDSSDTSNACSSAWKKMLKFLVPNCCYLLMLSLDLEVHERARHAAQGKPHSAATELDALEKLSQKLQKAFTTAMKDYQELFPQQDDSFFPTLERRIEAALISLNEKVQPALLLAKSSTPLSTVDVRLERKVPAEATIIWLGQPNSAKNACWDALFRNWDLTEVEVIQPPLEEPAQQDNGKNGVMCWFRDGLSIAPDMRRAMSGNRLECQAHELFGQPYAEAKLRDILDRVNVVARLRQSESGQKAKQSGFHAKELQRAGFAELYSLITALYENRGAVLESASRVVKVVHEQIHQHRKDPTKILLGGVQQGGSLALLVSLMLALDETPYQVGGVFAVDAHLPLAADVGTDFAKHLCSTEKPLFQKLNIFLRSEATKPMVDVAWSELIARTLHSTGLNVNFAHSSERSSMQDLWNLATTLVKQSSQ